MSARDHVLYLEAIYGALHVLMTHAAANGRGWYHYSNGELIIRTHVVLGEDGSS